MDEREDAGERPEERGDGAGGRPEERGDGAGGQTPGERGGGAGGQTPEERREAATPGERRRSVPDHPVARVPGEVPPRDRPGTREPGLSSDVPGRTRRLLDRAPGERFRIPEPEPPVTSPSLGRGTLFALAGWIAVVLAWLVLAGILGLDWGMLVVAVAGGWLVGMLASAGAWSRRRHLPRASARLLAALAAASAWLGGQAAVYLWTRVSLPDSGLDLGARIAALPFPDFLSGVLSPLDAIEIVLLAAVAWIASR